MDKLVDSKGQGRFQMRVFRLPYYFDLSIMAKYTDNIAEGADLGKGLLSACKRHGHGP